ncbi:hypothetical protein SAMN05421797_102355 [Maribacter ulvicola]|uniref:Uncharacterized protein n=1 Tax=Maribacter ulvicola TaxID=228959 RepID=A0A1N6UIM1_9FLAO|nr:hypothetical protein SAMN05421797_102355 [Maribacter ulvicola]
MLFSIITINALYKPLLKMNVHSFFVIPLNRDSNSILNLGCN